MACHWTRWCPFIRLYAPRSTKQGSNCGKSWVLTQMAIALQTFLPGFFRLLEEWCSLFGGSAPGLAFTPQGDLLVSTVNGLMLATAP